MKFDCELIQDLLPLYEEGLCSDATRRAVEAHFQECGHCRRLSAPLPIETPDDPPADDRAVKRSMKKVRRRWLASLLAAVLAMPLLLLCFNQYRGSGLCFTNLDDIHTARRFLRALENQSWEQAAEMHDFSRNYQSILDALGNPGWFSDQEYALTQTDIGWVAELTEDEFIEEMIRRYTADLEDLGNTVTFENIGYRSASVYGYDDDLTSWCVCFAVTVTQDSRSVEAEIEIHVEDGKIDRAGIYRTGVQWLDAIDRALYPSAHAGY